MTVTSKTVPTAVIRKDEAVVRIVMGVLTIVIVGVLWIVGAYFTSVAIVAMAKFGGVEIPTDGGMWLIVPIIFSIVEVIAFAYRRKLPLGVLGVAVGVGCLDFATSVYGTAVTLAGRTIPLMAGYVVPSMYNAAGVPNAGSLTVGIIAALVLTVVPEKVTLTSLGDIIIAVRLLRR